MSAVSAKIASCSLQNETSYSKMDMANQVSERTIPQCSSSIRALSFELCHRLLWYLKLGVVPMLRAWPAAWMQMRF